VKSLGKNMQRKRRRVAFVYLLCFVAFAQPIGFSLDEVAPPVSSDDFEKFLETKQIPVSTGQTSSPVPSATELPAPLATATLGLPMPQPATPPPVTPNSPNGNSSINLGEVVVPNHQSLTLDPLAIAKTSQPGVETYQPPENEIIVAQPWGGCWWEQPHAWKRQLLTRDTSLVRYVDLEQLVWLSVQYSPAIQSILKVPKVQRAEIDVARGELDPRFNARSNFKDSSDPVGNTLTTGGPNRLNEYFWENSVGITDRNTFGGKTELRQAMDARDSNSLFFKPNDQVDSRLTLNYTQPLKRGAGQFYNTSQIQIQQAKTQQEISTANERLQNHAIEIYNSYWALVIARFHFVQALNARTRLEQIRKQLEDRRGIDLLDSQIKRAEKEIDSINSILETLKGEIRASQIELGRLVGAPELQRDACREIIPLTLPTVELPPEEVLVDEYYSAVMYRGDLARLRFRIEQVAIQKKVAIHELQSRLDLVMESYVRGLAGDKLLGKSFSRQFDSGAPTYAFGAVYDRPQGNRTAKANVQSNSESLMQLSHEYEDQLRRAYAQVNIAIERSKGTYKSIFASLNATIAAQAEVELQQSRVGDYFADSGSRSLLLTEWLDAEVRLFNAERDLADRQIDYMKYLAQIKYESGTLLALQAE
jgi:outer membrane protein